jgi:hypothetical protein
MTTASVKPRKTRANSKSGAARAYLKRKPEAGPAQVVAALKKKGVEISPAQVSNVKARLRAERGGDAATAAADRNGQPAGRAGGKRRGRPPGRQVADNVSLDGLFQAREFADRVGGVDQASALLEALAKLQG